MRHHASRHSTPQSSEVARVVLRRMVAKHSRGFEMGMAQMWTASLRVKLARYQNHAGLVQLEAACAQARGLLRPVGHSRVAGCKKRIAEGNHTLQGCEASAIILCVGHKPGRKR